MSALESIFYMIWRGLAVGVLISAPMGPVGILCIQRTLDKGRKAGFYTGVGAAISDLIYCLLTGFGLSFIEDFLNDNQNVIQLIGSIVLIAFSIYLFRKNPSSPMRRPIPQNVSARKNILGGFLFTFSNPLIIFLIIGLFARFNFSIPEIKGGFYALGYLFILAGALGWWYAVTFAIDKVRSRFNMRSMKILNIVIGIVILGFACVGIIGSVIGLTSAEAKGASTAQPTLTAAAPICAATSQPPLTAAASELHSSNAGAGFMPAILEASDSARSISLPDLPWQLDFKIANEASAPMKRYSYWDSSGKKHSASLPPWSLILRGESSSSTADSLRIECSIIEYSPNSFEPQAALEYRIIPSDSHDFICATLTDGIDHAAGFNHYRLTLTPSGMLRLEGGNRRLQPIFEMEKPDIDLSSAAILIAPGGSIALREIALTPLPSPAREQSHLDMDEVLLRLRQTEDPTEGRWRLLDADYDDRYMRPGGEYTVAIVRAPGGDYEIIYLSGASVNSGNWKPGMLKGRLIPHGADAVWNLEWRDATGRKLQGAKAQRLTPDLLLLSFPLHSTTLRLTRLPAN